MSGASLGVPTSMSIEDLVARFIEEREAGERVGVETFVARHAGELDGERAEDLRRALRALASVEGMLPSAAGGPPRIGPYRVLGELGRGGMGQVLRVVQDERPGEELALKQLHPLSAANPRGLERFRREGRILAGLDHEGIVRVLDVQADAPIPYLVMELVAGASLSSLLAAARARRAALELSGAGTLEERVARIGVGLARAVERAHAAGLLHRDIKPSNVILRPDGRPTLVDFGLAVHEDSATLTETGDLLGTPHYMAPEQARGERAQARTDVYGVGAVLYELLTLEPPHGGSDPLAVLREVQTRPVVALRRRRREIPSALASVVERALHWRTARRYASAAALADDLELVLAGRPPRAARRGPLERAEAWVHFHPRAAAGLGALAALALSWPVLARGAAGDRPGEQRAALRAATLAWIAGEEQDLASASAALARLAPRSAQASLLVALAEGRAVEPTGDPTVDALAQGLAELEADRPDAALESFARASRGAPDWALPAVLAGRAARAAQDLARADRELSLAARLAPESLALSVELARARLADRRYAEAAAELERWSASRPQDAEFWSVLSSARARLKDPRGTIEACEMAMRLDPQPSASLLNRYAVSFDALGEHERARTLFRELLEEHPDSGMLAYNIAFSYDLECRLLEARDAYREALELRPTNLETIGALAHLAAGSNPECERCIAAIAAHPELYDPDECTRLLVRGIELDGGRTPALMNVVHGACSRIGPREEILAALRAAVADAPVDERVVRVERLLRELEGR